METSDPKPSVPEEVKENLQAVLGLPEARHAWKAKSEVRMMRFVKSVTFKVKRYFQYVKGDTPLVSKRVEWTELEAEKGITFRGTFVPPQPVETDSRQVKRWATRAIRFHNVSQLLPGLSRRERRKIAREA